MSTDSEQPTKPFRHYVLAECRRRWWHVAVAVIGVGVGVRMFLLLGVPDFGAMGAVCLACMASAVFGGLALSGKGRSHARVDPDVPRAARRRWFFAALLLGVPTSLAIGATAAAAAIPILGRYQSVWEWTVENRERFVGLVVGLSLVTLLSAHCWAWCTRGWRLSPIAALVTAGLLCFVAWELPAMAYFVLDKPGVPVSMLVFVGLTLVGWLVGTYRWAAGRARARPGWVERVLPLMALLIAGLAGFAVRAGLAAVYVARSEAKTEFDECVPSPGGRRVALLTAMTVDEQRAKQDEADHPGFPGLTNPWQTWMVFDTRDGSRTRLAGFSQWYGSGWSLDGRYFTHWRDETRTSLFLALVVPRHLGWERRSEWRPILYCYDTQTGSHRPVAPRDAWGLTKGWSDATHVRWVNVDRVGSPVVAMVHEADVATSRKTSRTIEVPIQGDIPYVDTRLTRLLVVERQRVSEDRNRSLRVHLADLDTGSVLTHSCTVEGRYVTGTLVSAQHAIVWAWDDVPTSQSAAESAEGDFRVLDSRLIDMVSGRQTALRGAPRPGLKDFWVTTGGHPLAERWVRVIRHGLVDGGTHSSLLDLQTGTVVPRLDWPAPQTRRPAGTLMRSPSEKRWLLLRHNDASKGYRFWTRRFDSPDTTFIAHAPTSPPDDRVTAPKMWYAEIAWVTDTELCFISQNRHLVFYDVVEKKRTKVVSIE